MDLVFKGNCRWDQDDVHPVVGPATLGDWLPANTAPGRELDSADWLDGISFPDLGLEPASETKQSSDSGVSSDATDLFSEQKTTFGFSECGFASPRTDLWDPVIQESSNFLYQSSDEGGDDAVLDDMSMDCIDANICLEPSEMDLLLNLDMLAVPEQPDPELLFNLPPTPPPLPIPIAFHQPPQFDFNDPMMYQYQPLVPLDQYQADYPALLPVGPVLELQTSYNHNVPVQAIQNQTPPIALPPFSSLPQPSKGKRRGPGAKTKGTKGVGVGGGKGKRVTFRMANKSDDAQLAQQIQQVLLPPHLKPPGWKHCQHFD